MKTLLILIIFISSLYANDPTELKGKLKEALDKPTVPLPKKEKTGKPSVVAEVFEKDLQAEVNQLVFKAFYIKDSIKRLMLEFEKVTFLLEANNEIILKDEKYRILNFNKDAAQLMHIQSKEILTFTYRP